MEPGLESGACYDPESWLLPFRIGTFFMVVPRIGLGLFEARAAQHRKGRIPPESRVDPRSLAEMEARAAPVARDPVVPAADAESHTGIG
jgi:hypothetical protein